MRVWPEAKGWHSPGWSKHAEQCAEQCGRLVVSCFPAGAALHHLAMVGSPLCLAVGETRVGWLQSHNVAASATASLPVTFSSLRAHPPLTHFQSFVYNICMERVVSSRFNYMNCSVHELQCIDKLRIHEVIPEVICDILLSFLMPIYI